MTPTYMTLLVIAGGLLLLVVLLVVVVGLALLLTRRKRKPSAGVATENMTIDLEAIQLPTLPAGAAALQVYGVPSQLVVLVLAPVGRGHDLPDKAQWRQLLEQLCPGFGQVLDEHQPVFRRWAPQVSNHGFNRAFFSNMKASEHPQSQRHWYKLAGRLEWFDRQILIGIVARTNRLTPLAPVEVEHSAKWREILKVGRFD